MNNGWNKWHLKDDWSIITDLLPAGWREKAKELGAVQRFRRFEDQDDLLRALLIHFVEGCSGRETAIRIQEAGIAHISDVGFLQRLTKAEAWLGWMAEGVMKKFVDKVPDILERSGLSIRVVDASCVKAPATKSQMCRLHYVIRLPSLQCDEVKVTDKRTGESFTNISVEPGDLLLGDRGYAHARGIAHVMDSGGHVLVRIGLKSLPLRDENGGKIDLLSMLETLEDGRPGDWDVWIHYNNRSIKGRVCAIRKDPEACKKARRKAIREHRRCCGSKTRVRPETLQSADYIIIFTTLDRTFSASQVLEIFRSRWQVELAFKRLKSIIGVGSVHNRNLNTARAWLHGKLLVAFLTEAIIKVAKSFSPPGQIRARFHQEST
jgi:Transposase DDE domain